ncbi:type II toxin-antitoxin system RelE/ParE family toxin [Sediminibacterium sp. C3]|uniref:type II toxin-antitoxin system RelE/ParE family toxin n=1 Tax=Sediminibacterium sp. C3 TaxID=1267211 RepID=UPI00047C8261|nr:type II toxin-antitoxin system RelE/ParE family toxin [Sediminibacterium sp. C3]
MIVSIRHKGLKLLWTKNDGKKLPAAQVNRLKMVLEILDAAEVIEDINYPGSALHALKGELKGFWAVTITGNYRIIFKFENQNVYLVDYTDYH